MKHFVNAMKILATSYGNWKFDDNLQVLEINAFGISICENYKHYNDFQFHDTFCMGHDSPMLDIVVVDHIFSK